MQSRNGFSLLELVVVILVLGILAAVAAPRFLNTSSVATDNGLMRTLTTVRVAIELYTTDNGGSLPGASGKAISLKNDLLPYLRGGEFPVCPVGPAQNAQISVVADKTPLEGVDSPAKGWRYSYATGEFIVNYSAPTASDSTVDYDEL